MTNLYYDLHIHSCLSPCGDDDMTPANIAGMAHVKGLQLIALTDHNTARNAPALMKEAERFGIIVLPGMELTTQEEIHVLFLFADAPAALSFDAYVYERLSKVKNRTDVFGRQLLIGDNDEITGEEEALLINATSIPFDACEALADDFGGVMIPAHLEKETTSLLSSFGAIPQDASFSCAEINRVSKQEALLQQHPYLSHCLLLHDSDAHCLHEIAEPVHTLSFKSARPAPSDIISLLRKKPS